MSPQRCFQSAPPGMALARLGGLLVALEGPDAAGRTTHAALLASWLEERGYPVVQVGLRRSWLVGPELEDAKKGNVLSPRTMSLFYATDFYDLMENVMVPALRAGFVVLADRYVFTLMARDLVRGAEAQWVESLYSRALVPDLVCCLRVSRKAQAVRALKAHGHLGYWESGMDLGLSRDRYECFLAYQERIAEAFDRLAKRHGFDVVNANRSIDAIQKDLRARLRHLLAPEAGPT